MGRGCFKRSTTPLHLRKCVARFVTDSWVSCILLCPRPGAIISDDAVWRLSVWRLLRTSGRRAACAAGRLHGAYWLIGPGPARPAWLKAAAARFRWRPRRRGYIVAATRLQLVMSTPPRRGIKRWCCLTSVCLSVVYTGPIISREQRGLGRLKLAQR